MIVAFHRVWAASHSVAPGGRFLGGQPLPTSAASQFRSGNRRTSRTLVASRTTCGCKGFQFRAGVEQLLTKQAVLRLVNLGGDSFARQKHFDQLPQLNRRGPAQNGQSQHAGREPAIRLRPLVEPQIAAAISASDE